MNAPANTLWNGTERRGTSCRRHSDRRRTDFERRCDTRGTSQKKKQGFYRWLRSITNARLGVDRRKNIEQRLNGNRRSILSGAMLTKEELADLLN